MATSSTAIAVLFLTSVAALSAPPLFSRSEALALVNHPLVVQLGTGDLPAGSFHRCLLAREAIIAGFRDGAAEACTGATSNEAALDLLAAAEETAACAEETSDAWRAAATEAGKTIQLPPSEVEAGVRCYSCGGDHYNVDCPDEARCSSEALALAGYLRSASTFGAAAAVLGELAFAHRTLAAAGLDGGDAYAAAMRENADTIAALVKAVDRALDESGALKDASSAAQAEASTATSLLYATIDSEASEAGLKSLKSSGLSLQAARERLDEVESGFIGAQDKNAQFLKDAVLGAQPKSGDAPVPTAAASGGSAAARRAAATDAAAAYLRAKTASKQKIGADAQAAVLASKAGPKQAAARSYLAVRKKQQAAQAYLDARKQAADLSDGDGVSEKDDEVSKDR